MCDFNKFAKDLELAQNDNKQACERIFLIFNPLINKYKYIGNKPDEELLCELYHAAFLCIKKFKCNKNDLEEFLSEAKEIIKNK